MQRLFAGISWLAVLAGVGFGGYRWWRTASSSANEATAVLQVPAEYLKRGYLFQQAKGETEAEYQLADAVVKGTLTRLVDRQVALKSADKNESPRNLLRNNCRVQLDSESGQDRVTLSYRGPTSSESLSVLTAVVDTLGEIPPPPGTLTGSRADGRPSPLTILSEREGNVTERIQALEQTLARQTESLEQQGLSEAERVVIPEQMKRLGVDLAEARRDRLEAEHRLIQTRKDLAAGLPVDLLISRLPGNAARDVLQKVLTQPQLTAELQTERAEYDRLLRIYGKKHPRMLELQEKIDALQARASALDSNRRGSSTSTAAPADLLQKLLCADLEERQALERDLQDQFDSRKNALDQQAGLSATSDRLQKELQTLQDERDTLRRKIVEARRQWQEHATEVLVPPGIVEVAADSRLPFRALIGCVGGLALTMGLFLQRLRRRSEPRRRFQSEDVAEPAAPRFTPNVIPTAKMPTARPTAPSPLAALLATRKTPEAGTLDQQRDKADRAARLARLKSLTQSPTLAPHSV